LRFGLVSTGRPSQLSTRVPSRAKRQGPSHAPRPSRQERKGPPGRTPEARSRANGGRRRLLLLNRLGLIPAVSVAFEDDVGVRGCSRRSSRSLGSGEERASENRRMIRRAGAAGDHVDHCLLTGTRAVVSPTRRDAPAETKLSARVVEKCVSGGLGVKEARLFAPFIGPDGHARQSDGPLPECGFFPIQRRALGPDKKDASRQAISTAPYDLLE
jgi:hypothetical protein